MKYATPYICFFVFNLVGNGFSTAFAPSFSLPSGIYQNELHLELNVISPKDSIYYTVDGSLPTTHDYFYSGPILIDASMVIRAKVFSNKDTSATTTKSYIIDELTNIPFISIVTSPTNLWDNETGIYVMGENANSTFPYLGANFWQDWERPIYFEFFDVDGTLAFSINAGIKIHGDYSRVRPQKSFAIFARKKYGQGKVKHRVFPDLNLDSFEAILLRAGGDWGSTMFRDAYMQKVTEATGVDKQAYRPAHVYLNGKYWGIYNIREKVNEHFLSSHHKISTKSIDLLGLNCKPHHGEWRDYYNLRSWIDENDMSDPSNYEYVCSKIDIDNYIKYNICEIYFANTDWPGNNIKYWRSSELANKWRWIFYDLDSGFIYPNHNTLSVATQPDGNHWPNPPWSTMLLRNLLENDQFKRNFITTYCDYANTIFKPSTLIAKLEPFKDLLLPNIQKQIQRWTCENCIASVQEWLVKIEEMENFAEKRNYYLQSYFQQYFHLEDTTSLHLQVVPENFGSVRLNKYVTINESFSGLYFKNQIMQLEALPGSEGEFQFWVINGKVFKDKQISFKIDSKTYITADYIKSRNNPVLITEINYHPATRFDAGEWVEIYNNSSVAQNISNWVFTDMGLGHQLVFPPNTFLNAYDYIVLCEDTTRFKSHFSSVTSILGNFNFSLNNAGESLVLLDSDRTIIDSLTYSDRFPWPREADGLGSTLVLKDPSLDNSLPSSWTVGKSGGNPGKVIKLPTHVRNIAKKRNQSISVFPNPFNATVNFDLQVRKAAYVELSVHNVLGQLVDIVYEGFLPAGQTRLQWNRGNADSDSGASGFYVYTLEIDGDIETGKILAIR